MPLSSYSWPTSITPKVTSNAPADFLAAYDRLGKIIGGWNARGPVVAASTTSSALQAVADYVCDGTADQTEINTAIGTGRPVLLLPGTFVVNATIAIAASNVQLYGSGWGTVIQVAGGANVYAVTFTATAGDYRDVRISDLKIDANGANQTTGGGGINANAAVQCFFERLYVQNAYEACLRLGNSSGGGFGHHNRVIGCLFDNGGTWAGSGYGLDLFATDENFIAFCDFESLGGNGTEPAHIIDRAGLNKFFGCNFVGGRNNARGIRFKDCHRSQVIGGTFDGVAGDNISIDGSSFRIIGVTFGSIGDQGTVAASGVLLNNDAVRNQIVSCYFQSSGTASKTRSYIRETGVGATPNNRVLGGAFDTVGALSVGTVELASGSLTRISEVNGYTEPGTNPQSGTTYTLALSDSDKAVELTSASAVTVTVPPNSSVAFPIGTVVDITRIGTGGVTVAAGAGVTIRTPGTLVLRAQYSSVTLRKRATDEWVLAGDTT